MRLSGESRSDEAAFRMRVHRLPSRPLFERISTIQNAKRNPMRRTATMIAIVLMAALLSSRTALAEHQYVGAESCKICHKAKTGDQWQKWLDGPHAQAYETLKNERSAAIVAEMGLSGNAWELDECLSCHVTGHGQPESAFDAKAVERGKYAVEQGVGCESCHGPGADYKKMKTMQDHDAAVAAGLSEITAETCTACHNEKSPTFAGFDYESHAAKIAHPIPDAGK